MPGRGNEVIFPLHHRLHMGSAATQPPIPWVPRGRGSFPEGKTARPETDHSAPSTAEGRECVELYIHSTMHHYGAVLN